MVLASLWNVMHGALRSQRALVLDAKGCGFENPEFASRWMGPTLS